MAANTRPEWWEVGARKVRSAVRARAAILAELIGVPLRDETDIPVNLRRS